MLSTRKIVSTVMAVLAAAVLSADLSAQEEIILDVSGGAGIPVSDVGDFQDFGPSFQLGVDLRLNERFSARASGGASILSGKSFGEDEPDINPNDPFLLTNELADFSVIHFNAGPVFHVLPEGRWNVDVNVGGGVAILTSERQELTGVPIVDPDTGEPTGAFGTAIIDLSELAPNVTGGVDIGYQFSQKVEAFVGADAQVFFLDEDDRDVAQLTSVAPELDAPETGFMLPIQAGLKFHFLP